MSYPSSYDSISTVSSGNLITATQENAQSNAINAIETTLGLTPYGPYSTVAAAVANKLDNNYVSGTQTSGTYAVTLSPAPSGYTAGMFICFKADSANTGACSLNVNSLGAKAIKKQSSVALGANDIVSGQIVAVVYDGTNFQMLSAFSESTVGVSDLQTESNTYAADSGSANVYAVTLATSPGSYSAGLVVQFKATNANTGASTLNVNSLGTKTIKKLQGNDLGANDILAGQIVEVIYDGTNFQMMSPFSESLVGVSDIQNEAYTYAADTGSANTYAVSLSTSPGSYTAGLVVQFQAANANTGASTLNVNSLGAKNIKKQGSVALGANDILSG